MTINESLGRSLMTAAEAGFTGKFCVATSNSGNFSDSKFIYSTVGKTGIPERTAVILRV